LWADCFIFYFIIFIFFLKKKVKIHSQKYLDLGGDPAALVDPAALPHKLAQLLPLTALLAHQVGVLLLIYLFIFYFISPQLPNKHSTAISTR
jgi:hypothetical protein